MKIFFSRPKVAAPKNLPCPRRLIQLARLRAQHWFAWLRHEPNRRQVVVILKRLIFFLLCICDAEELEKMLHVLRVMKYLF
jgi:hypothetical protein